MPTGRSEQSVSTDTILCDYCIGGRGLFHLDLKRQRFNDVLEQAQRTDDCFLKEYTLKWNCNCYVRKVYCH